MRRLLLVAMCLVLFAGLAHAQSAPGIKLGVGGFGGLNYPLVQDDQGNGTAFGFKGRVQLAILTLEPNIQFAKYGDADLEGVISSPEGSKITGYGLDAVLGSSMGGPGLSVVLFAGIGSYTIKNDQLQYETTEVGYSGGLGLEIGLGQMPLSLEVRGRLLVIPTEGDGSKKSAIGTVGASYHFGL